MAGAQVLMIFLVVHLYGRYSVPALLILTVAAVALVVLASHRAGPLAGGLSGLMLILSVTIVAQAGGVLADAVILLAVVGCLATLPGGGLWERVRGRAVLGFGILLAAALAVTYRAMTLAVGVVLVWLLVSLRQRRWRNDWTLPAVISLGLAAPAFTADMMLPGRKAPYRSSWLASDTGDLASVAHRVFVDELFSQLARDRVLYAVCLLTIVALVVGRRSQWCWLTLGMVGSAAALLLISGPGNRFGDLLVAYPAMILVAVEMVTRLVAAGVPQARSGPEARARLGSEADAADATIPRQRGRSLSDMVG